ncbi:MAG: chondroitin lyase [Ferruginibacter sp.]|nr:chondroitin lyase [Ferruginibacter sp.]
MRNIRNIKTPHMKNRMIQYLACIVSTLLLITTTWNSFSQDALSVSKNETDKAKNEQFRKNISSLSNLDSDIEIIRKRIIDDLLEPAINTSSINKLVKTIQTDGSWPDIDYKDTSRTGFQHREHLEHMVDLSRAYKKPGSPFYQDIKVKTTALSALDFWLAHNFICANWWWNEMGTPNLMINTLLLLDTDLSAQQQTEGLKIANRANLETFGARPGGDLIAIAGMLGKQGVFKRDEATVDRVIKTMATEIKISNERGLQPDMSFHHRTDNVISTLTYGTNYASSFAYWAVKIAGTKFTLPEASTKLLIDYYLDGISKSMAFGKFPDIGAKNRDLSRKGSLDPAGTDLPANLLRSSDYRKAELETLIKIRNGAVTPNLHWNRFFWHSEYFTHQRPKWFSSVRMHSSRQNNMEEPHNEEGLKNHHFADGSNFITITGKEYVDVFPVWDWQKIPGATIVQKPALPSFKEIAKKGKTNFVGAVSNGEFGAAATDFSSPHDPLQARKAWFYFKDEYVCLGTAINSTAAYPVATTLNQCNLNGAVTVKTDKGSEALQKGTHALTGVSWVHHGSVAYLFPTPTNLQLKNTTATGSWRLISHQDFATEEPVQRDLFTLWLDHGTEPVDAGYAYIVVPAIAAASIEPYRKTSGIHILANTPQLQAVRNEKLNLTEAVFYKAATIQLSNILAVTAENPCMLLIEMQGKKIKNISVSDPTHLLKTLELKINSPVQIIGENGKASWNNDTKLTTIAVELPKDGNAGKSIDLHFGQ